MSETDGASTDGTVSRLRRAVRADTMAGAANALFGGVADRVGPYFSDLETDLEEADMRILFRTYLSQMFLAMTFAAVGALGLVAVLALTMELPLMLVGVLTVFLPLTVMLFVFMVMYFRPSWRATHRARDINRNLPFALNHMSAVSGSGVPPSTMFQLLVNFDEYGEIASEAEKIVTRVDAFGEDVSTAIRDVAEHTPSDDLRDIFYGMVSTSETGGSLEDYLSERSERALFDYRIKREKEIKRLTTFASFYTAILVAAPLFLVTILAILEVIGGSVLGFPIKASCGFIGAILGECPIGIIDIGAFILIPVLNVLFIITMEVFQPEI